MRPNRPLLQRPRPDPRRLSRRSRGTPRLRLHQEQQFRGHQVRRLQVRQLLLRVDGYRGPGVGGDGAQRVLQPGQAARISTTVDFGDAVHY